MSYKFYTTPWEHQVKALDYLIVRDTAALYLDMGSGKTKIGIDMIVNRAFNITLIVTTKKSCYVWEEEIKIHTEPNYFDVYNLNSFTTKNKVIELDNIIFKHQETEKPVIMVINYDSIWIQPFADTLLAFPIDCIICDESHRIKSPQSRCSLFLTKLGKKIDHRYLFTGTPTPERPTDIYAQYRFLDPSIFGTNFTKFRNEFENIDPIKTAYVKYRVLDKKEPYKNLNRLKEKMYSCAFYVHVDLKLPPTSTVDIHFTPSQKAIHAYKTLSKESIIEENGVISDIGNILAKILRLQEILSGYKVYQDEDFTEFKKAFLDTKRIDCLEDIISNIGKEKVVIFAGFRWDFDNIKDLCLRLHLTYGEISGQQDDYTKWKNGDIQILVVHYKSGSESISLVEARYCVYYSLTHSFGLYEQSKKRVHRPKQDKPVTYYHIIAQIPGLETIDEKIVKAWRDKKSLIDYLLDEQQK